MTEGEPNIQKPPLFKDWSPYQRIGGLPENITYTPPQPRKDLRRKLRPLEGKVSDPLDEFFLRIALSFLEMGMMRDNFGGDDEARNEFLLRHTVGTGRGEITLYDLSQEVNKLQGNNISIVITALTVLENGFEKKFDNLKTKVERIKRERGYFLPDDLAIVDEAAMDILKYTASRYGVEI